MNIRTQWGMKNGEWNQNETNRKVFDGDYWSEVLGVYFVRKVATLCLTFLPFFCLTEWNTLPSPCLASHCVLWQLGPLPQAVIIHLVSELRPQTKREKS
jgi:hypothetical protein